HADGDGSRAAILGPDGRADPSLPRARLLPRCHLDDDSHHAAGRAAHHRPWPEPRLVRRLHLHDGRDRRRDAAARAQLLRVEGGHVNVTLGTDRLPPGARHLLDALANVLAALIFGFLAAGAADEASRSIALLEYRLGVYRFPLWPFKTLYATGLVLLTIQLA